MSDIVRDFLDDSLRLSQYRAAIKMLEEIGFDRILEIIGRPAQLASDLPDRATIALFEHADSAAWCRALDYVFRFEEVAQVTQIQAGRSIVSSLDFGAMEQIRKRGYSVKDLEELEG